jgi:hypothetical protein
MSRKRRCARHVTRVGERGMLLVGKSVRKSPLGRPRLKYVDNIKMDVRYDGFVWTGLM